MLLNKKSAAIVIRIKTVTVFVVGLSIAATARSAKAAFTFYLQQVGPDVVITGSGTIDTAGLPIFRLGDATAGLVPNEGIANGGPLTMVSSNIFSGVTGPSAFGTGNSTDASSGSGDAVGVVGGGFFPGPPGSDLTLPGGYVSGTALSDTDTYVGQTFATLGFTPGTYTYTFGTGPTADSLVVTSAGVPEPASLGLLSLGGLTLLPRRRRCAAASPRA
jgi:hypothetical protein